ncbi:MAG: hypothetical protein Q8K60_09165 [Parachlamydiaceae bacterium]|nr:hypothetical protein [Parachlamydiaceae bacterium]
MTTIERLERFKSQTLVQEEYKRLLKDSESKEFNKRQDSLYLIPRNIHRQLSFRYILNKEQREKDENVSKQYRQIAIDLMKILYEETFFYKEMENKNSKFLEEMIDQIQEAADEAPKDTVKRVEDMARLKLKDPELQDVYYHMLKGSVTRPQLKLDEEKRQKEGTSLTAEQKEKTYVSLLTYIHYSNAGPEIQLAPRELLEAIFENPQIAEDIIVKRIELAKDYDSKGEENFKNEFNPKRKTGLSDQILNFKVSKTDKSKYD